MKTYEDLVSDIKKWVLENNKAFSDFELDDISDKYAQSLIVPDDQLDIQDAYVENGENIIVPFKATIQIDYRAAVHRKKNKFVYFKLCQAIFDDDGNIIKYELIGYDW